MEDDSVEACENSASTSLPCPLPAEESRKGMIENLQTLSTILDKFSKAFFVAKLDKNVMDITMRVMLYNSMNGRKYLIVLDDRWSTKFWDEIKMYFRDSNNVGHIVITTKETGVANYADSLSSQHKVKLLSKSESWNLLYRLVFGEEDCPLVLQEIGRKIANDCSGLPLAISWKDHKMFGRKLGTM